jgi:hypothetical protein
VHCAWIIADVAGKDEARSLVPPGLRRDARVVGLNKFSIEDLDSMRSLHATPAL